MKDRIKKFRQAHHMTQEKMAESMNLSKGYIYQIEAGKQPISDRFISDMCRIFGANETWIRTGEGPMLTPMGDEEELLNWVSATMKSAPDSFKIRLVRALTNLRDEDWAMLERFVEGLKKAPDD